MAAGRVKRALSDFEIDREQQRARMVDALLHRPGRLVCKPEVFLVDLDGTLADVDHRDPFDTRRCDEDPVNASVLAVVRALQAQYRIVLTTGRK